MYFVYYHRNNRCGQRAHRVTRPQHPCEIASGRRTVTVIAFAR